MTNSLARRVRSEVARIEMPRQGQEICSVLCLNAGAAFQTVDLFKKCRAKNVAELRRRLVWPASLASALVGKRFSGMARKRA